MLRNVGAPPRGADRRERAAKPRTGPPRQGGTPVVASRTTYCRPWRDFSILGALVAAPPSTHNNNKHLCGTVRCVSSFSPSRPPSARPRFCSAVCQERTRRAGARTRPRRGRVGCGPGCERSCASRHLPRALLHLAHTEGTHHSPALPLHRRATAHRRPSLPHGRTPSTPLQRGHRIGTIRSKLWWGQEPASARAECARGGSCRASCLHERAKPRRGTG